MTQRTDREPPGAKLLRSSPKRGSFRLGLAALWVLQGAAAAAFLAAGAAKLLGVPMMVDVFARIGIGQWFRFLTGVVELAGAAMLLAPALAGAGALLLAATMVCAVLTHLLVIGGDPSPAILLLVVTSIVAVARRKATLALVFHRER